MRYWIGFALVLAGCSGRGIGETAADADGSADGGDSGSATSSGDSGSQSDTSATTHGEADSGSADADTGGSELCPGVEADYTAVAEPEDTGLGIANAPATITNCTSATAYVRSDCCHGPTYSLERRDTEADPWMMATFSTECDCEGFVEPLVIEPGGQLVIDTCPPCVDSVPLCSVGSALYRWTFFVGPDPNCDQCWQPITTNEFSWYCEG